MRIYIAAPLFNEMEIERNASICEELENYGFEAYLPQRDGGLFYELRKEGLSETEVKDKIFYDDFKAILACDIILCLLDGRVPDEGMCIELGMAYALKKICIGYKTDYRNQDKYGNNIMIDGALSLVFHEKHKLTSYLSTLMSLQSMEI